MFAIVKVPSSVLRTPCEEVKSVNPELLKIIDEMIQTLKAAKNPDGVGLAAPQVDISKNLFLIRPLPDKTITVFINPQIIKYSQRTQGPSKTKGVYEGCLSLPGHYAPVTRSMSVTIKYQKLNAIRSTLIPVQETFTGFAAHIIQHEMDHLNGILFIDRVLEQNSKLYRVDGKDWTEIDL